MSKWSDNFKIVYVNNFGQDGYEIRNKENDSFVSFHKYREEAEEVKRNL